MPDDVHAEGATLDSPEQLAIQRDGTRFADDDTMGSPQSVMLAGDWHGNLPWARQVIRHTADHGADAIVQLGDFGFWVDTRDTRRYLDGVQRAVDATGVRFYWLDGNHEDHSRDFAAECSPTGQYPLLRYLPRGHRWTWMGRRWMALGGAYSVDRHLRTIDRDWWAAETLTGQDIAHACDGKLADVVLAHDCPLGVDIPGVGTGYALDGRLPVQIQAGANRHRERVREVWASHHPSLWVHGHYHVGYRAQYRHTTVIGLDRDGAWMPATVEYLTPDVLREVTA